MKVVSSNSETDLARERARSDAQFAMRALSANILRIVRGAGAPHDLLRQMRALEDAMLAHWEADRSWPLAEISGAVWLHEDETLEGQALRKIYDMMRAAGAKPPVSYWQRMFVFRSGW